MGTILHLITIKFQCSGTEINYQTMGLDVVITVVMAELVGAVIALVNGKLK